MNFTKKFVLFSITNAVVFYLAHLFLSDYVLFGNAVSSFAQSIFSSSVIVGLIAALVGPFERKRKLKYSTNVRMVMRWAANTLTIYLLARISSLQSVVGMGITSFWVAIVLGFVTNLGQYGVLMSMGEKKRR